MTEAFLKLLNMSITASWLVLAVMVVRSLFRKMPKWCTCFLWGVVALRLLLPFSWESAVSLVPSAEVIPQDILVSQTPAIHSGIPAVNSTVNPMLTQQMMQGEHLLERLLSVASAVWLAGMVILLLYGSISYLVLRSRLRVTLSVQKDVRICDDIDTPFVLGALFPCIYLPSGIKKEELGYVLAHERAHIQRRDHWWKPLGYLLLTVYWFNPLLWLAYFLLCRDIERACDEKVISEMDNDGKIGYSQALLACGAHRRMVMICPVAFGEVDVKSRIKGIIRYKKPGFWILLASSMVCIVTAVCFLTNPKICLHAYGSEITVDPTCTQVGMKTHVCELCKHSYNTCAEVLAHAYDEGIVTEKPTCTQTGTKEYTCTGCGIKKTETVEKMPHTAGEPTYIKEPNCTEKGEVSATCTACRAVFAVEILETNDAHNMMETVLCEATCTAAGEGVLRCTRCDYSEGCTYSQLKHTLITRTVQRGTCMRQGIEETLCIHCDYTYLEMKNPTGNHVWTGTPYVRVCEVCGFQMKNPEPDPTPKLPASPVPVTKNPMPTIRWAP